MSARYCVTFVRDTTGKPMELIIGGTHGIFSEKPAKKLQRKLSFTTFASHGIFSISASVSRSLKPLGSTMAPERTCDPTLRPLSSTTTRGFFSPALRSSAMAVARPAGPAPTIKMSVSIAIS